MITAVDSSIVQRKNNPSFGKMSLELERFVKTPNVIKELSEVGIDKKTREMLYKSPVEISFLRDLFSPITAKEAKAGAVSIPETAGLVVIPPRSSHLPNLCVTADDKNFFEAGIDSFVFSLKKVVELVDSYKVGKVNLNNKNRLLKVRKIEDSHQYEKAIKFRLKSLPDIYNYGDENEIMTLSTEINQIDKIDFQKKNMYDVECASNKKAVMAEVRDKWLNINARRVDVSA